MGGAGNECKTTGTRTHTEQTTHEKITTHGSGPEAYLACGRWERQGPSVDNEGEGNNHNPKELHDYARHNK